jgi:hypothetical protein
MPENDPVLDIQKARRMRVRDLKDLCKILAANSETPFGHVSREVYCCASNGEFVYYIVSPLHDYWNLRSVPIVVYSPSILKPREFLWYNVKTGNVSSNVAHEPSSGDVKDTTVIFPIVFVEELPDFLEVW